MAIPICLAMTAAEFLCCQNLPSSVGWMACHFSSSGSGLSNLPSALPQNSILMVDDHIPFCGHDPETIARQLTEMARNFHLQVIILDFQREAEPATRALAALLHRQLPCSVVITPDYAPPDAPILLPPCPLNTPLQKHIADDTGREIWLEIALEGLVMCIDKAGCHTSPVPYTDSKNFPHWDKEICCHYTITPSQNSVSFHLQRSRADLQKLLEIAPSLGIVHAIGLWQEFG